MDTCNVPPSDNLKIQDSSEYLGHPYDPFSWDISIGLHKNESYVAFQKYTGVPYPGFEYADFPLPYDMWFDVVEKKLPILMMFCARFFA